MLSHMQNEDVCVCHTRRPFVVVCIAQNMRWLLYVVDPRRSIDYQSPPEKVIFAHIALACLRLGDLRKFLLVRREQVNHLVGWNQRITPIKVEQFVENPVVPDSVPGEIGSPCAHVMLCITWERDLATLPGRTSIQNRPRVHGVVGFAVSVITPLIIP